MTAVSGLTTVACSCLSTASASFRSSASFRCAASAAAGVDDTQGPQHCLACHRCRALRAGALLIGAWRWDRHAMTVTSACV